MAAGGFKEFVAGEVLDQDEINDYLMQGMLVFAGTAARGSAITAPVEGQFSFLADSDSVEFFDGSQWVEFESGAQPAEVSGTTGSPGTVTSGGFNYYTFTGDGSIIFSKEGLVDVLLVGGGGGGGSNFGSQPGAGGGGGAGEFAIYTNAYVPAGTATVTLGAGGAGNTILGPASLNGGRSQLVISGNYFQAIGGGGAGAYNFSSGQAPNGGSGGGGTERGGVGGGGLAFYGNNGGDGLSDQSGGAGGGAGGAGGNAVGNTGGAGGIGTDIASTWASATSTGVNGRYAGGGGGGGGTVGGAAGDGGGGAGATGSTNGGAGTANTGGGGGGAENVSPGAGGSGIVIVRIAV